MKESDRTVPMLYERNDAYVIEAFRQGSLITWRGRRSIGGRFFSAIAGEYFT